MFRSFARAGRLAVSLGVTASLLAGCGGGGGGSGGGGGGGGIPGTLVALAVQGGPTPGAVGGTFASFGPGTLLDVYDGGWTAFVSGVVAGTTPQGLFVARPDGSVVDVFVVGETVPTPGTGTISGFTKVWMRENGIVVCHVLISGGSDEGILTARVPTPGAATEKAGAIYRGTTLPAGARGSGAPGALTSLDPNLVQVDDQGSVFFVGVGTGGTPLHGVWTVDRSGASLTPISVTGDTAPIAGTIGFDIDGLGIDGDGTLVAYACDVIGGPTHAILATDSGASSGVLVSQDGSTPPSVGGRTFENVYDAGPLYVTLGAGTGFVTWQGDLTGSAPDRGVFTRQVMASSVLGLGTLQAMVVPGQAIAGVGLGAIAAGIRLVNGSIDPNRIPVDLDIAGGTSSRGVFSAPDPVTLTGVFRDGQVIPTPADTTFTATFPSLTAPGAPRSGDRSGSLAFSAVLANGSSGVYWAIFGGDFHQVARQGGAAPGTGGGTFSPFLGPIPVIPSPTCVVFVADVVGGTATSGLFRQQ